VAASAVLVKEFLSPFQVCPFDFSVFVQELIDQVGHALVFSGEGVSGRAGLRRISCRRRIAKNQAVACKTEGDSQGSKRTAHGENIVIRG
jgi:hypothetical protein